MSLSESFEPKGELSDNLPKINLDSTESSENILTDSKEGNLTKSGSHATDSEPKQILKNKIQKPSVRARFVPSRYKQAALEVSQKSNSSSDTSKSISSYEKARGNHLAVPSRSMKNISKIGSSSVGSKSKEVNKYKSRMHSTAVNSSVFFEKTQLESADSFSNTIVGGQVHFKYGHRNSSLSISDISGIGPTYGNNAGAASLVPDSIKKISLEEPITSSVPVEIFSEYTEAIKEYTNEEIKAEYLKYLIWALMDVRSEDALQKQMQEAKNEVNFMAQLVMEEEKKLSEETEKLMLLKKYEKLSDNHESLKKELEKLKDVTYPSEKALKDLHHCLETQVNQIKWENIHIPEDEETYRDQIKDVLEECTSKLSNLNLIMQSQRELLESDAVLFDSLKQDLNLMNSCLEKAQNLSKLSIQEASLKLSNFSCDT